MLEKDGAIRSRALVWFKIHNCLMDFQVSGGRDKGRAADRVDARKVRRSVSIDGASFQVSGE